MNSKSKWLIAIMIVLLLVTSVVSALGGISLYHVDWGNPHHRGTSTWITAYINNNNGKSASGTATLQLSVPGWYTRTFQQSFNIPGYAKQSPVTIYFTIDQNWPTGNYKAQVTIPSLNVDGAGGTIIVN